MIVPPTLTDGRFMSNSGQTKAEPNRAAMLFVLIAGAGIVAALAAANAIGPFAGLRPHSHSIAASSHLVRNVMPAAEIEASTLFPPPGPPSTVLEVVNVYDLPAPAPARSVEGSSSTAKSDRSEHEGTHSSPPPPSEGEGGQGGGGGAPGGDD